MNTFMAFIRKEFHHIFRDKRTLMVLFGMPLAQLFLFGYAITTEIRNAPIAILDQSHDVKSTTITTAILATKYFTLGEDCNSYQEIEEAFRSGRIKAAVIIPPRYGATIPPPSIQIISDGTDPNSAVTIVSYLRSIIGPLAMSGLSAGINVESRMYYNLNLRSVYMFVPGVITIVMLLVSAMLTSISITREKELGNMEILLVSPLQPFTIIVGKVVPYLLLSMLNVSSILTVGMLVFNVPMMGSWLLLGLASGVFIICALSLGVLISTIAKSQQVALMVSLMGLMMPTILLSNFIFPISSMPVPLQVLSNIIPAKYFISIIRNLMLKGAGIDVILKDLLVLCGMTLFFIGVSVKKFKIRL